MASTPWSAASTASATHWIPLTTIGPDHTERSHSTSAHDRSGSNWLLTYADSDTGSCAVAGPVTAASGHVGEADRLGPHERPRPTGMDRAVEQRAEAELGRHLEAPAHVALAPTEHGRVDGQHQRLVAGLGAAVDHLLDEAAITPGVHLEPPPPVADRSDLLDRAGGQRRQRVRQAGAGCGPGHCELALRVGDAGEARRAPAPAGSARGRPSTVVDGSTCPTDRRTRGRNSRRAKAALLLTRARSSSAPPST